MIDYFAALQQPRRPWLDPAELKKQHQELTLSEHPDRHQGKVCPSAFATVNDAYRVLSDPKLRLQHLLNLEGHSPRPNQSVPTELMQLFAPIGSLIQDTDRLLESIRTKNSALGKSLLQPDLLNLQQRASNLFEQLQTLYAKALDELRQVDVLWQDAACESIIAKLQKLHQHFAYLGRWMDQIRERQFQLSI